MNLMHSLTRIQFTLVSRKIHFTLDEKFHLCGICIVMSNDGMAKIREEMDNNLENFLKEIRTNENASTVKSPRSETIETQNSQPSGSKTDRSVGVRASNTEKSDSEDEDYLLRPSDMKDLRHPAKPLY